MSSKQHRTAGADYRTIEVAGKMYTLRPLTVGAYASMEAFIISRRPDPLLVASEAVKKLPPSQHDVVWKAAMSHAVNLRLVTTEDAAAFENSVDGIGWKLWQMLAVDHPEIDSLEAAKQWLQSLREEQFEYVMRSAELASGEADIKKSSGPAEATGKADLDGLSYTENYHRPMDGPRIKSTV